MLESEFDKWPQIKCEWIVFDFNQKISIPMNSRFGNDFNDWMISIVCIELYATLSSVLNVLLPFYSFYNEVWFYNE